MKNKLLVLLLLLGSQLATAKDLLITNAILHTQGKDGVIENTDILIKSGRIARIAPRIATNKMIRVINAEGHHVTPALFAGLTVSGLSEVEAVRESVDSSYSELYTDLMHPEFDVRVAYNPHSSVIPITRVEGFGYTLLTATRGDRSLTGQGGLVRFDGGYDSFEGGPVVYVQTSGRSANKVGGSRVAHWMLLQQAFAEADGDQDADLLSVRGIEALNAAREEGIFVLHESVQQNPILSGRLFCGRFGCCKSDLVGAQRSSLSFRVLEDDHVENAFTRFRRHRYGKVIGIARTAVDMFFDPKSLATKEPMFLDIGDVATHQQRWCHRTRPALSPQRAWCSAG